MDALDPARAYLAPNAVPIRRRFLIVRPDGDGLMVHRRLGRKGIRLNKTASAIWSLCDGRTPVASISAALARTFENTGDSLGRDIATTLIALESQGLLTFREVPRRVRRMKKIDLREIPFYVINCTADTSRRDNMERQLSELGLQHEFVVGTKCEPGWMGSAISHQKILNRVQFETPFAVLEDDCVFNDKFQYEFIVPANTDAFYLGVSRFGISAPGELSWGKSNYVEWSRYDANNLRVFNMLGAHAIVYLTNSFRRAARAANLNALANYDCTFPGDVGLATIQLSHLVLTPLEPICYQGTEFGGQQGSTERSLINS